MKISLQTWNKIVATLQAAANTPDWLIRQVNINYSELSQLPVLDVTIDGQDARPDFTESELKEDYLDFLKCQINLNARGAEWKEVLQRRLTHLQPYVGKKVLTITFFCRPEMAILRWDSAQNQLIQLELN